MYWLYFLSQLVSSMPFCHEWTFVLVVQFVYFLSLLYYDFVATFNSLSSILYSFTSLLQLCLIACLLFALSRFIWTSFFIIHNRLRLAIHLPMLCNSISLSFFMFLGGNEGVAISDEGFKTLK